MSIIAKKDKTFTPHPAGMWQAVCVDVVDLGELDTTYSGVKKKKHFVKIVWQTEETGDDGRLLTCSRRYTLSLDEKATLRRDLESWRGRQFTEEELKGFDLEKLLGVNCFLNIIHESKDGEVYGNVASVAPLKRGMPPIEPSNYIRFQDREGNGNKAAVDVAEDLDIPF